MAKTPPVADHRRPAAVQAPEHGLTAVDVGSEEAALAAALARPETSQADPHRGARPEGDGGTWMPGIEVLRGLAAATVVVFHLWVLTKPTAFPGYWLVLGFGLWAVDLFFLLSGFLLVQYFWRAGKRPSLRAYYIRRVFRIAPAYYVSLALLFLFFADRHLLYSRTGLHQVLANVTLTQWIFPSTASSLNVNGVYWTLSIEMMLYAILPVLAITIGRRPVVAGLVFFTAGVGYRLLVALDGHALQSWIFGKVPAGTDQSLMRLFILRQFPGILPLFVIGMLLRWWVTYTPRGRAAARPVRFLSPELLALLLVPSLVLLLWIERASDYHHWIWFTGFDVALAVAAAPALIYASRPVRDSLRWPLRGVAWLGERSYSVYLWHFPIILLVFGRGPLVHPADLSHLWLRVVAAVAVTVAVASLSYRFVEVPGREAGRRLARSFR